MEFDLKNMPQFNLSYANNMLDQIQRQQEENLRLVSEAADERNRKFDEARQAAIETAENTAEMKEDLKIVIRNQNSYIKMLEKQNETLKNIFASGEDGVLVQKEIMKILEEQGENDGTFRDKGLDAGIQAVFLAVQMWLKSKGIDF